MGPLSFRGFCLVLLFVVVAAADRYPAAADPGKALIGLRRGCPTISVSCPSNLKDGEPLTFVATVRGGNPSVVPVFTWTVSAGKIIKGQGSSSITVETVGHGGQSFTGSVSVSGFELDCPATASCSFINERNVPSAIRFDAYGALPRNKEIAKLRAFAVQLKNQPGARGYVVVYGGRVGRAGEAQRTASSSREYLIKILGIDDERIVTVDAGYKEELTTDLWLVPTGANPPVVSPTVDPSEVKPKPIKAVKKRSSSRR